MPQEHVGFARAGSSPAAPTTRESSSIRGFLTSEVPHGRKQRAARGVGFFTLLGLLFIGLKLAGLVDWAWWVVLAPIWGQLAFAVLLFFVLLVAALAADD